MRSLKISKTCILKNRIYYEADKLFFYSGCCKCCLAGETEGNPRCNAHDDDACYMRRKPFFSTLFSRAYRLWIVTSFLARSILKHGEERRNET